MTLDFGVIADNWRFLLVQGLLGIGAFGGGTSRWRYRRSCSGFLPGRRRRAGPLSPAQPWLY